MYSLNPIFESRKKGAPFTQEQLNIIREYIEQGFSIKDIIELTGISRDVLKQRIKDNDWISTKKRNHGLTQQELNEIKYKYSHGYSVQQLSDEYNISTDNLNNRIANNKWTKTKRKTHYYCDETYFDTIDTEHKAYWLGFLFADGYITSKKYKEKHGEESQCVGFSISTKDIEMFVKFRTDLKTNYPVHFYSHKINQSFNSSTKMARILITSQHMVDSLKKLGMVENKTLVSQFPKMPNNLIPHFIRGYSDGDGSIAKYITKNNENKCSWKITSTKEMCLSILKYLHKENLKIHQKFPERQKNNWTLSICGNQQVPKLLSIIYKDATIFLQRKYNKYVEIQGSIG